MGKTAWHKVLGCTTGKTEWHKYWVVLLVATTWWGRAGFNLEKIVEDLVVVGSAVGWWRPTAPSSGLGVLVVAANSRH